LASACSRDGVAHERQVGHQERPVQSARHGSQWIDHVVHRHRHRGVVPLDHHAERIADQHHVDIGLVEQHGEAGVVAGEAGDLLALARILSSVASVTGGRDEPRSCSCVYIARMPYSALWRSGL
jgi:hypothetical protein